MHVYETGKSPPSVYGWRLSDRPDYLYFTTHTHTHLHTCVPHSMDKVAQVNVDYF